MAGKSLFFKFKCRFPTESRKLCFVIIERAKETLVLSIGQSNKSCIFGVFGQRFQEVAFFCGYPIHSTPAVALIHYLFQGDLARKKIYPTLWFLYRDGLLPKRTTFIGYARSSMTVREIREKCTPYLKLRADEEALCDEFWKINHYVAGAYDSRTDFEKLNQEIGRFESGAHANRLFYLALPPSAFQSVSSSIRNTCMGQK